MMDAGWFIGAPLRGPASEFELALGISTLPSMARFDLMLAA